LVIPFISTSVPDVLLLLPLMSPQSQQGCAALHTVKLPSTKLTRHVVCTLQSSISSVRHYKAAMSCTTHFTLINLWITNNDPPGMLSLTDAWVCDAGRGSRSDEARPAGRHESCRHSGA